MMSREIDKKEILKIARLAEGTRTKILWKLKTGKEISASVVKVLDANHVIIEWRRFLRTNSRLLDIQEVEEIRLAAGSAISFSRNS